MDCESGSGSSYRWVVLVVAFLVHATTIALIWQAVSPLKKAMAPTLGTSWEAVALVYSAFSLGLIFTQIPGGALGDKYPVRYVVGVGSLLVGLATALRFAVPTLQGQIAVSLIATVGMGIVNPNLIKVVTEWFPPEQLGLGQGVLLSGNSLASAVALSVSAGAALDRFGSWQRVFLVYGALTIGTALLWMATVHSPRQHERPTDPKTAMAGQPGGRVPFRDSMSAVFRAPSTKWSLALAVVSFWALLGSVAILPEFADAQPYTVAEVYLGLPLVLSTVGALTVPTLSDRFGRATGVQVSILGTATGFIVAGFAPSLVVFLFGLLVSGFFSGGLTAMLYTLPGSLQDIDTAHAGTMAGVILSLANIGGVAGSATTGYILSQFGIPMLVLVGIGPITLGIVFVAKLQLDEVGATPGPITAELGERPRR